MTGNIKIYSLSQYLSVIHNPITNKFIIPAIAHWMLVAVDSDVVAAEDNNAILP
jgi:hypothetical protein